MDDVIHLTVAHPWNDPRILLKECASLVRHGISTVLVVPQSPNAEFNGVRIVSLGNKASRLNRIAILPFKCAWFCLRNQSRFVHFHDPELLFVGLFLAIVGRKVVYDSHENLFRWLESRSYKTKILRFLTPRIARMIEKICVNKFHSCIAATPEIAEQLPKEKTFIVQNFPLSLEISKSVSSDSVATLDKYNLHEPFFIYAGIINSLRGVPVVVEAMQYVASPAQLVIAGGFKETGLEAKLRSNRNWNRVRYIGHIERDDLLAIMRKAVAGIVTLLPAPKYVASYPTKMFEYWATGLPVIASNFPLWRELVANGGGLCVDPTDPKSVAKAMNLLLTDQSLRSRLSANAESGYRKNYRWESQEAALLSAYSLVRPKIDSYTDKIFSETTG